LRHQLEDEITGSLASDLLEARNTIYLYGRGHADAYRAHGPKLVEIDGEDAPIDFELLGMFTLRRALAHLSRTATHDLYDGRSARELVRLFAADAVAGRIRKSNKRTPKSLDHMLWDQLAETVAEIYQMVITTRKDAKIVAEASIYFVVCLTFLEMCDVAHDRDSLDPISSNKELLLRMAPEGPMNRLFKKFSSTPYGQCLADWYEGKRGFLSDPTRSAA
jgi:hypothetical protein